MKKLTLYTAAAVFLVAGLASTEGQAWGLKNLTNNKSVICTRAACGSPIVPDKVLNICFGNKAITDTVKKHPNCTKAFHSQHCTNKDGTAADDRDAYETQCQTIEKISHKYLAPIVIEEEQTEVADDEVGTSDDGEGGAGETSEPAQEEVQQDDSY